MFLFSNVNITSVTGEIIFVYYKTFLSKADTWLLMSNSKKWLLMKVTLGYIELWGDDIILILFWKFTIVIAVKVKLTRNLQWLSKCALNLFWRSLNINLKFKLTLDVLEFLIKSKKKVWIVFKANFELTLDIFEEQHRFLFLDLGRAYFY